MHKFLLPYALFTALVLSRCTPPVQEFRFMAMDSLMQEQITVLAEKNAALQKTATINNKQQDTLIIKTDTVFWKNELGLFSEINLMNRPLYRDRYRQLTDRQDVASNLMIREFRGDGTVPVTYLRIYYQDSPNAIRKLEAAYRDSTALLNSKRFFMLEFVDLDSKSILSSYSFTGSQKLLVGDSVRYSVKARVLFN